MNKFIAGFTVILFLVAIAIFPLSKKEKTKDKKDNAKAAPYEYFMQQRMYPDTVFDDAAFKSAMRTIRNSLHTRSGASNFNAAWELQGPGNIGGRINCIAVHPSNQNIILVGNAAGGIFKTIDGGANWYPVFDDHSYLAISCITFNPQHPDTLYAGTGDRQMTRYTYNGNGIYRSTNGGDTWSELGLAQQGVVAQIVINPQNTNEIYAAAMGSPFVRDSLRGIYKSIDAGQTWQQSLIASTEAGCIDLMINPDDPQILYAASWNGIRSQTENINSGANSRLWKTTNGGGTWTILNAPFNDPKTGRISMDMSRQNPDKLYVCVVDSLKSLMGIYLTTDGGTSWTPLDVSGIQTILYGGPDYFFGWYFGVIEVNPWNDNQVYVGGIQLYKADATDPNSIFWEQADPDWWTYEVHADKHDIAFLDSTTFLLATDGGLYKTSDLGLIYSDVEEIPNTQFYRIAYNPHDTASYFGGAQDNGSMSGSASFQFWNRIYGGDGFRMIFHPYDNFIFYCETQWGGMVFTDDGGSNFNDFTSGIDLFTDRVNWDFPYIMNATDPNRMYAGTNFIYKMNYAPYDTWYKVSGDLTDGNVLGSSDGQSFNVISALDNSVLDESLIYAGTSDGNVWRSDDDCNNWINITGNLPDRFVTAVKASPNDPYAVFVSHSGYRANELIPHVHRSADRGGVWTNISGNLPQIAVNDLLILPGNDSVIFAATDGGVFATLDGGSDWQLLGSNMPLVPVYELCFNVAKSELVAGTFGRSLYTYSLDSLGVSISPGVFTHVKRVADDFLVRLFPNPADDFIIIETREQNAAAEIFDASGRSMKKIQLTETREQIDISAFPSGYYLMRLNSGSGNANKKFFRN